MVRPLYRFLLRLHPAGFRRQFEEEMLWIFDEASGTWGASSLFADAAASLLRQWLFRSQVWQWVVATVLGFIPLIAAFGSFLPWDKPLNR